MGKWVHRLTNKNEQAMTAICAECGPVNLRLRNSSRGKVVCCETAWKIDRANKNLASRLPHGMTQREAKAFREGKECAICGAKEDLVVDHCHVQQKVRDVLCNRCNKGLGCFRDRTDLLRAATDYLERHRNPGLGDI